MIGEPVGFAGQMLTRLNHDEVRTTPFAQENRPIAGWNQKSRNASGRDAFDKMIVAKPPLHSRLIRTARRSQREWI